MKQVQLTLLALLICVASRAQVAAITGPSGFCVGTTATYSDLTPGGSWLSSAPTVATIGAATGIATGVSAGAATLTYVSGAGYVTYTITVNPLPSPIVGPGTLCVGATVTLSSATSGGTWSGTGPISMSGGIITGIAVGTAAITYTLSTGCAASTTVTVMPNPSPITGTPTVCAGATTTLTATPAGGTWTSSIPAVFTASPSGVLVGVTSGSATVVYTLPTGCSSSTTVSVNPAPTAFTLSGGGPYCAGTAGSTLTLSGSQFGFNYQAYAPGVPMGPVVSGTGGPLTFGPFTLAAVFTVEAQDPVTGCTDFMTGSDTISVVPIPTVDSITAGGGSYCTGASPIYVTLNSSDAGMPYQMFNGAATVGGPVTGTGTSLSFGPITASGTYTIIAAPGLSCATSMSGSATISINPLPNIYIVSGGGSYCSGGIGWAINLSSSDPGINYQLYVGTTAIGTIVPGTGSAISFGAQTVAGTYTAVGMDATTGCSSNMAGTALIAINPLPLVYTVTGGGLSCGSSPISIGLSGSSSGVDYQLYNGTTAVGSTVPGTGSPISLGGFSTAGTYTVIGTDAATGCVNTMSGAAGIATGSATMVVAKTVACGGLNSLSATGTASYVWAPATGLSCTGCSNPTVMPASSITYTVIGTDVSGCTASSTVAVDANSISGAITYSGGSITDLFKVWLIHFNPSDSSIVATDSMTTCMVGSAVAPFFQFMDPAPGSYLVKAELLGTIPGTSGYIPTYDSSTPYWYAAKSATHGTGPTSMPIVMQFGTVPVGPGFISGYVYAGAGKGTSGDAPDPGVTIYLKSAATGKVLTYTQTDASGYYSFGSLAYGQYIVYPESYKYYTTPSDVINITASAISASGIDFRRSTTFGTIKPKPAGIEPVTKAGYYIAPNPTSGDVSVTWPISSGDAVINVTDLTGRIVYNQTFNANNGKANIALSELQNGIYFIAIRTDNYNYGTKLLIQK